MKKISLVLIVALLLTIVTPLISSADTGQAKDGFYKLEGVTEYVPLTIFQSKSLKEKITILTGNYYLILNGQAIKAIDIIITPDAQLESKMMSQTTLEKNLKVKIDSNGNITPSDGFEDDGDFKVLSIE